MLCKDASETTSYQIRETCGSWLLEQFHSRLKRVKDKEVRVSMVVLAWP